MAPVACRATPLQVNGSRGVSAGLEGERVQRGVEQGGVQGVLARAGFRVGQGDLGVEVVAESPGGGQALEGGPVRVARVGEPVVRARQVERGGAGRRPGGQIGRLPRSGRR